MKQTVVLLLGCVIASGPSATRAASIVKATDSQDGESIARMIYTGPGGGPNSDPAPYWALLGKAPESAYEVKIKPDKAAGKIATLNGDVKVSVKIRNQFEMGTVKTDKLRLVRDDSDSDKWYVPAKELERIQALVAKNSAKRDSRSEDAADLLDRVQKYAAILGETQQAFDNKKPDMARAKLLSTDPDLRGWEFDFLLSRSTGNKTQWTLPNAHGEVEGRVSCVTFTASGERLILGRQSTEGASGSVSVWDFVNDRIVPYESLGGSHFVAVARSRNGKTIAAAGCRGKVVVWDAATGKVVRQYSGHNPDPEVPLSSKNFLTARSLDYSPDGKQIVSSAGPNAGVKCINVLKVWSVETGKTLMAIEGEHQAGKNRPILSVSFSPDGKTIASGGFDGAITLWDAKTGKELRRIKGPFVNILDLEFSPDGKRLACGSVNSAVWEVASGKELTRLMGYPKPVSSLAYSPDGKRLVTGGWDRTVRIWDPATGVQLLTLAALSNRVNSVAFSSDGKSIAAAGPEGRAIPKPIVWSLRTK